MRNTSTSYGVYADLEPFRKTTTMLFKIVGIEKAWHESDREVPHPRQVFVTKSRMLADKVEDYLMKLLSSTIPSEESGDMAAVTRWRRQGPRVRDMVNIEEDDQWRADLPRKFSDLSDEHFPLAVPFDVVCCPVVSPCLLQHR